MPEALPLVTVIAICFNHERFVLECLEGIRSQTYPNVQLIVVDDCSTDDSARIIRGWVRDTGVDCALILHDENRGVCRTRNEALALARGEYVSSVSTDDVWAPEKIALQVERMAELPPSVGVLYADADLMDEQGRPLPGTFLERLGRMRRTPEGEVYEALLEQNFIPAMTTLVRTRCYETVGGFDETLDYEDWDMWLRIAREYEFAHLPRVVARYRLHPSSLSQTLGSRFWDTEIRIFLKHVGHSPEWDAVLWGRIAHMAYRVEHPRTREFARSYLGAAGLRALPLYALASTAVPYRRVAPLKRALNRLASRGRSPQGSTPTSL